MSSNVDRVVLYHIGRLQDKNADVRMKSIKELELLATSNALSGLEDVLSALQTVFKNEGEVPEVRKAAQEAGRSIFLKQKQAQK